MEVYFKCVRCGKNFKILTLLPTFSKYSTDTTQLNCQNWGFWVGEGSSRLKWRSKLQLCWSTVLLLLLEERWTWLRSPRRQLAQNIHFVTINRWQFCCVTEMYAPAYPPSVVASVSYCALPLRLPAFGGNTLFKCYFYPNTKRGLARVGPACAGALSQAASAMLGQKIRFRVIVINTCRWLSGMTLVSLCKAFYNHWDAQQSPWSDSKDNESPFYVATKPNSMVCLQEDRDHVVMDDQQHAR